MHSHEERHVFNSGARRLYILESHFIPVLLVMSASRVDFPLLLRVCARMCVWGGGVMVRESHEETKCTDEADGCQAGLLRGRNVGLKLMEWFYLTC